jgi:hypothetical protein
MLRTVSFSLVALAIGAVGLARANDTNQKADHPANHHVQATITKVDRQKDTITVMTMDKNGREEHKTYHLQNGVEYVDSTGKPATLAAFHAGDEVQITEQGDKVTQLKKHAEATITNVNPKAGTLTVRMKDKNGKEVERTFHLAEDATYLDSTGRVATLEVFRAGDRVLVLEGEGRLKSIKKMEHNGKTPTIQQPTHKNSGGK